MSVQVEIRSYCLKYKKLHLDATTAQMFIRFLEADEYFFGSGYLKEFSWRRLRQFSLTEGQKGQVREVAIALLARRIQREFRDMAITIRQLADEAFRIRVEKIAKNAPDEAVRKRAVLLAAYLVDIRLGRKMHRELKNSTFLSRRARLRAS